jgi:hypothetical protein
VHVLADTAHIADVARDRAVRRFRTIRFTRLSESLVQVWVWYPQDGTFRSQRLPNIHRKRRLSYEHTRSRSLWCITSRDTAGIPRPAHSGAELIKTCPQVELPTEHVLHAGMYARTVRMPAGTILGGALIKVRTMVIVNGHTPRYLSPMACGDRRLQRLPRKREPHADVRAITPVEITMMFPTQAKTVAEAERVHR